MSSPSRIVVSETEAAQLVGLSIRTLQRLRVAGGGPTIVQLSDRRIGYSPADLEAWVGSRRLASTSAGTVGAGKAA